MAWQVTAIYYGFGIDFSLQGPRTPIDAFQTNIFSWLNDILTKIKLFLESYIYTTFKQPSVTDM